MITAILSSTPYGYAHRSDAKEQAARLDSMAEEANLVFIGSVVEVTYRQARIEGGDGELPYTIVTYRVRDVLRGKSPGDTFTMRFPGGADGRGSFIEVSGVPVFQVGDQDLLFVRGNGEQGCPLVQCEQGRFRILGGAVYNTHGFPVRGYKESQIIARGLPPVEFRKFSYPAPSFDNLMQNPEAQERLRTQNLSLEEARKRYESQAPKQIEVRTVFPATTTQPRSDQLVAVESPSRDLPSRVTTPAPPAEIKPDASGLDEFVSTVKDATGKASRAPVELKSVDPNAEIVLKLTGPQAASAPAVPQATSAPATAEEEAEIRALEAQDFNPVIRK
jgi:hypothetical protein